MELTIFEVLFFCIACHLVLADGPGIIATKSNTHFGIYESAGSVRTLNTKTQTVAECTYQCVNFPECVTFFFNNNTGQCVMHSKDFNFQNPSIAETGWFYYVTIDASERCPPSYLYYRYLNFCYRIGEISSKNVPLIKADCHSDGGRLAAIDSPEKDDFFSYILQNRPHVRVVVGGERTTGTSVWTLEDGSQLDYFNWNPGEPNTNDDQCLELKTGDQLHDCWCTYNQPANYVCEKIISA